MTYPIVKASYNMDETGNKDFRTFYFETSADIVHVLDSQFANNKASDVMKEILYRAYFNSDSLSKVKIHKCTVNENGKKTTSVPIDSFDSQLDTIILFVNGTILIKNKDYTLSQSSGSRATITFKSVPLGDVDYLILQNAIPSINSISSVLLKHKINSCISYEITSPIFENGIVSFEIGAGFNPKSDFLIVSANSVMYSSDEYSLVFENGKYIIKFTRPREQGETVDLIILKNIYSSFDTPTDDFEKINSFLGQFGDQTRVKKHNITITSSNKKSMAVPNLKFNKYKDSSLVFRNSIFLIEGKDYKIKQKDEKVALFDFIYEEMPEGSILEIYIFENMYDLKGSGVNFNDLENNSISSDLISGIGDLKILKTANKILVDSINELFDFTKTINNNIGNPNELKTTNKKLVNAINEIISSQNIIDNITEQMKKKVDKVDGMGLSKNDFTDSLKSKLDNIAANANNYQHPNSHSLDMISETDLKKILTSAERIKLNSIAVNANNYQHPSSHPPSIIEQDASNRFVSDNEKTNWNNKADKSLASNSQSGLMSSQDKAKLSNVEQMFVAKGFGNGGEICQILPISSDILCITDKNGNYINGNFMGVSLINTPNSSREWYFIEQKVHNDSWVNIKVLQFTDGFAVWQERRKINGVWQNWIASGVSEWQSKQIQDAYNMMSRIYTYRPSSRIVGTMWLE